MYEMTPTPEDGSNGKSGITKWIVGGALVAFACGNGFLLWRTSEMDDEIRKLRGSMQAEVSVVRESAAMSTSSMRQSLDQLNVQVEEARAQAGTAAKQARAVAQKHAEKLVSNLGEQQQQQHQAMEARLGEMKQAAEAATVQVNGAIDGVKSDVGTVRSEVAQTKSELDKTITDLRSVRGDLGVQSGLIATNARELAVLREIGERNYFEFDIPKTGRPHKVANIQMTLKKADLKRNKFTVDLIADDRRVEKKDKTSNEPVQFYVSGGRLPYELVVNEVRKDRIIGYLATPKVVQARR